jgi:hypothetical protein
MMASTNPLIDELERRFLPRLEVMAAQLRNEFPDVRINTWSWSTGTATTDNPAHNLGIDCLFPFAPPSISDNVALIIGVIQVNRDPHLSELQVSWGADSTDDCIDVDLLEAPIPWSPDAISRVEAALPTLLEVLTKALRHPPFPRNTIESNGA